MVCKEKRRLLSAYQRITEKYAAVLAELHEGMGTMSKGDYDSLYSATEVLHSDVTRAQGEYNSHVVAHGC